jgi:hypothetical protein
LHMLRTTAAVKRDSVPYGASFLVASLMVSSEAVLRTHAVSLARTLVGKSGACAARLLPIVVYQLNRYDRRAVGRATPHAQHCAYMAKRCMVFVLLGGSCS